MTVEAGADFALAADPCNKVPSRRKTDKPSRLGVSVSREERDEWTTSIGRAEHAADDRPRTLLSGPLRRSAARTIRLVLGTYCNGPTLFRRVKPRRVAPSLLSAWCRVCRRAPRFGQPACAGQ